MGGTPDSLAFKAFNTLFVEWLSCKDTEGVIRDGLNKVMGIKTPDPVMMSPPSKLSRHAPPPLQVGDSIAFETPLRSATRSPRSPSNATMQRPVRGAMNLGLLGGQGPSSPTPPRSPVSRQKEKHLFSASPARGASSRSVSPPTPTRRAGGTAVPAIGQFFFPHGKAQSPSSAGKKKQIIDRVFGASEKGLTVDELFTITTDVCGLSSYCNSTLFQRIQREQKEETKVKAKGEDGAGAEARVTKEAFLKLWKQVENVDLNTRFFRILSASNLQHLRREDFEGLVQEIVDRHPGLEFLETTPEFQVRYAQTVIGRMFFMVNTSGNEKLTLRELKRSNFIEVLGTLDSEDDINKINDYFSYEHFYVIYCKFWELDCDHDSLLDRSDLLRYDDYSLTSKIVDRIFEEIPRKFLSEVKGKMGYLDFVPFLIAEVDKTSEVALSYWFRCIDLDGDGVVAQYEVEHFFSPEQQDRMQTLSQEDVLLVDVLCQLLDAMKPTAKTSFMKKDIRKSKLGSLFFNTLFNCNAMIAEEQRDPGRIKQNQATPQLSVWDRYAIAGYYRLAEPEDEGDYDDEGDTDYEDDDFADYDDENQKIN